jgi:hypothetical protein
MTFWPSELVIVALPSIPANASLKTLSMVMQSGTRPVPKMANNQMMSTSTTRARIYASLAILAVKTIGESIKSLSWFRRMKLLMLHCSSVV